MDNFEISDNFKWLFFRQVHEFLDNSTYHKTIETGFIFIY